VQEVPGSNPGGPTNYSPFTAVSTSFSLVLDAFSRWVIGWALGRTREADTFGQFLLDNVQKGVVFQRLIGVSHPGFPKILHRFADEAIGETALLATREDYDSRC
jgi:hypothetical protein